MLSRNVEHQVFQIHADAVRKRFGSRRLVVLAQLLVLIGAAEFGFHHWEPRYWLAFDLQPGEHCLVPAWYWVDRADHAIRRGDYVAFAARGMSPFYPDGTRVIKQVIGVVDDRVVVNASGVWVNGHFAGALHHLQPGGRLWRLGHHVEDYLRNERVPAHHWWVMGTSPRSYDSRYWGFVTDEQIIGRARALW
jgi:conjugal transfer pilin signal peptidase TrbI